MQAQIGCLLVLASVFLCERTAAAQEYGVVTFNMRGVDGTIKFIPLENGSMRILADLNGFTIKHGWHVHNLPVDTSLPPAMRCDNDIVGPHFDPLDAKADTDYANLCMEDDSACEIGDLSGKFGPLTPTLMATDNTGDLTLYGRYGIIGRAVKIHGTEDVCGTIYSSTEMMDGSNVALLQASFVFPFGGTMYFRQVEGESTIIFGKIFWTTGSDNTMGHNWHVHANQPSLEYREGTCSSIGGHYNPYNVDTGSDSYSMYCNEDNMTSCEVGDLSGKHGRLNVSGTTGPYREYSFLYHDSFLNLTGTNAVVNRSIAIHSLEGPVQGCAPLVEVEKIMVSSNDGFFRSSQMSRYSRTNIYSHMMYDNSDYKIFSSAIAPNRLCSDEFKAGHSRVYNPHEVPSPDGTDPTPDRYSVGNLTSKHENIASGGYVDELPIYGIETISGHSLGLSYGRSDASMTYTCRTLRPSYPEGASVKMAKATFNGTVMGAIYFTQRDFGNGVYGTTHIIVDIWYTDSTMSSTSGHNWHIHQNAPVNGQTCGDSIGPHFNPFNVNITAASGYADECTESFQLRCESGDLSGKHGVLNIDPASSNRETVTYTDTNLHLYGPEQYSIIGRSVGLHLPASQGGSLFECGEITEVFEASSQLSVSFAYSEDFDRATFATMMTENLDSASPSDMLLTGQSMMASTRGTPSCVNANITILGSSTSDADSKLQMIQSQFGEACDDGSGSSILLPSIVILLGLLILNTLLM